MNLTPDEDRSLRTVNASHEQDGARWTLSYTQHTATALRRRTLAVGNGHAAREDAQATRETAG